MASDPEYRRIMQDIYNITGVYRITNIINGKSYFGKTMMNFGKRWDHHRSMLRCGRHGNANLQKEWDEYGEDNFEFEIVKICDDDEEANKIEIECIAKGRENDLVYNIAPGGRFNWATGKHLPEETKRKIGEKNRKHMTGRKLPEETKKKMSESQKKRMENESPEARRARAEKVGNANRGRKMPESAKEKLRKINQDNPPSAKLTPDDVRFIRKSREEGMKLADLAEMFDTTAGYISNIVHRLRWSHID